MENKKTLSDLTLEELWDLFPITLVDNEKKYIDYYYLEEKNLNGLLKDICIYRINHIGSTSIPYIKTKPIVDILLEIKDTSKIDLIKEILINNSYILMSFNNEPFKYSFNKGYTIDGYSEKVYHLHIKKYGDCDELYFRDYLINHNDIKKEYEILKIKLLKENPKNRDQYTYLKTKFVNKIVCKAQSEYLNKY